MEVLFHLQSILGMQNTWKTNGFTDVLQFRLGSQQVQHKVNPKPDPHKFCEFVPDLDQT